MHGLEGPSPLAWVALGPVMGRVSTLCECQRSRDWVFAFVSGARRPGTGACSEYHPCVGVLLLSFFLGGVFLGNPCVVEGLLSPCSTSCPSTDVLLT